ncbi:DUF1232 domain-containing protein [Clostridiaceae bacterium WCA-383-APC-5B]|uniref:DUF1232 domain-containing protein n=1 Tax=Inconstantimicrobium porci TaxID=2652291 RepID=A0A7X2MX29_9CLOT|nr:DUF1232 domain-containing protein [Inconstantimicrobium porci]
MKLHFFYYGGVKVNISNIDVRLSGDDIISIINDFIKIDGLNISSVSINDDIVLEGNFKNIINIPFRVAVELKYVQDNVIVLSLGKVKLLKMGIIKFVKNYALKMAVKSLSDFGIISAKGEVSIDLKKIFRKYPFINLELNKLSLKDGFIIAETKGINISKFGQENDVSEEKEEEIDEADDLTDLHKVEDLYTKGRDIVESRMPEKVHNVSDYILLVPDIICLIYRLLKDERVTVKTKAIIVSSLAYVSLPTDIIPDKIPFIGRIDDIGVIFFALNKVVKDTPLKVIVENWEGKNDIIIVLKKAVDYLVQYTHAENVEKIYSAIEQLTAQ